MVKNSSTGAHLYMGRWTEKRDDDSICGERRSFSPVALVARRRAPRPGVVVVRREAFREAALGGAVVDAGGVVAQELRHFDAGVRELLKFGKLVAAQDVLCRNMRLSRRSLGDALQEFQQNTARISSLFSWLLGKVPKFHAHTSARKGARGASS